MDIDCQSLALGSILSIATMHLSRITSLYRPARVASTHIKSFGLSPDYIVTGDTSTAIIATYPSLTPGSANDYRFVFVKGLGHAYPNGTNHWMVAAPLRWDWLKQFSLP